MASGDPPRQHRPRSGPPAERGSAGTRVAAELRAGILAGTLRLGQRLDQKALAREYGVSLIPLREALRRLAAEGLVRMEPRRGAFVAELSLEELTETSWIRERLEELAVRLAAPRLDARGLAGLAGLHRQMEAMPPQGAASRWRDLNRDFHFAIYSAGDSPLLIQLISALWDRTSLYREVLAARPDARAASVAQHADILTHLEARNAAGAGRAMRTHIRRGMRDMRATGSRTGHPAGEAG